MGKGVSGLHSNDEDLALKLPNEARARASHTAMPLDQTCRLGSSSNTMVTNGIFKPKDCWLEAVSISATPD
jgi:hypothetical protein